VLAVLERYAPFLPYTVVVFVLGFLTTAWQKAVADNTAYGDWQSFFRGVELWEGIEGHLLLYSMLPPLLFAEVMKINVQLVRKCFWQCFVIAGPGVILGTLLTGTLAKYVLPYGWGWPLALNLGAMLSATDPVAVMAICKSLGVSERLSMLVAGESLLNDGVAIMIFQFTLRKALDETINVDWTIDFILKVVVLSPLIGATCGFVSVAILARVSSESYHSDALIQVVITICCAYLSFFLAESEMQGSGVLGVIVSGYVMACYSWPLYASIEVIHVVWETVEMVGNTVIFFLAGLLFAATIFDKWGHIEGAEFGWLLVLYLLVTATRAVVIGVLWPLINRVGQPVTTQESAALVWGGLRGAVSLALAIIVDESSEVSKETGARIMFYAGGIAALSLLINATTMSKVMVMLGLVKSDEARALRVAKMGEYLHLKGEAERKELLASKQYQDVDKAALETLMPHGPEKEQIEMKGYCPEADVAYRETFLANVQMHYWAAIEEGVVPRRSRCARILLNSVLEAKNDTSSKLTDFECLKACFEDPSYFIAYIVRYRMNKDMTKAYAINMFLHAHEKAREMVPLIFEAGDEVEAKVAEESENACAEARKHLETVPAAFTKHVKTEMVARKLITSRMSHVKHLEHQGLVSAADAQKLEHHHHEALVALWSKLPDGSVAKGLRTSAQSEAAPVSSEAAPASSEAAASEAKEETKESEKEEAKETSTDNAEAKQTK